MEKYYKIITYGCQMNLHDSEKIAGVLEGKGYLATADNTKADVIVFNTCCIRHTAERKALGNILAYKQYKAINPKLILAVVGCMSQQPEVNKLLSESYPFVDIVLGTGNLDAFSKAIDAKTLENRRTAWRRLDEKPIIDEGYPLARTSGANAWLDITYGCDNFCSYCIVPHVRGRERSRDADIIVAEASTLIEQGYKEITLLGQNVNSYYHNGIDFACLLERVAELDGDFRLRFLTSHPKDFSKKVVKVIADNEKISNYIHLPVQAGSNKVLADMNRRYTREHYLSLLKMIRDSIPKAGITTDIMVGFPGEDDKDFQDTLDLVRQARFSSAFTFKYSRRKGTDADKMKEQVPEEVKKARIRELISLQNQITLELSQDYIGQTVRVLVEDKSNRAKDTLCGREDTGRLVNFEDVGNKVGDFCNVIVTHTKASSLWGRVASE